MKNIYILLAIGAFLVGGGIWIGRKTVKPEVKEVRTVDTLDLSITQKDSIERSITSKYTIIAKRYQMQIKKLAGMPPETIPTWLEDTTQINGLWMRSKRIENHAGFWIIRIGLGKNDVKWVEPRFYPFYK